MTIKHQNAFKIYKKIEKGNDLQKSPYEAVYSVLTVLHRNIQMMIIDIDKNPSLAKNLKGKLFLVTGDIDNNVHPGATIRMANELIKANKRFDFMLLPTQRHGFGNMTEYNFWLRADHFTKHLLGNNESSVDINQINNQIPQSR